MLFGGDAICLSMVCAWALPRDDWIEKIDGIPWIEIIWDAFIFSYHMSTDSYI